MFELLIFAYVYSTCISVNYICTVHAIHCMYIHVITNIFGFKFFFHFL